MIKAGEYNNSFIEDDWAISLPGGKKRHDPLSYQYPGSQPLNSMDLSVRLWHYCQKSKTIRCYSKEEVKKLIPRKAVCFDCKKDPSEELLTTFFML